VEWSSIHDCSQCTRYHAKDDKSKEICAKCFVPLHPDNEDAAMIFSIARYQFVTVGADNLPIDLNIAAIMDLLEIHNIKNKQETLRKVMVAGRLFIKQITKR